MGYKFQDSTATYQATWTSSTAQNTTLQAYGWGYSTAIVTVQNTGTITGGVLSFLGYDGYNWYNLQSVNLATGILATTYALSGGSASFAIDMTGFSQFGVQLSTAITGSGSSLVTVNESGASISAIVKTNSGSGNQPVSSYQPASSTATWTSSTSLNTALSQSAVGMGTATVTAITSGTISTGVLTFQVGDGTNFWTVSGQQIGGYVLNSTYSLSGGSQAWQFDVQAFSTFQVKLTTALTGTSPQVILIVQMQSNPNVISPTVGWGQQLDATNDSISSQRKGATYTKVTTSAQVSASSVQYWGYTCESIGTAGTLVVYDNTAASGNTVSGGTITLAAGTFVLPEPLILTTGCYAATSGTPTVNILTTPIVK